MRSFGHMWNTLFVFAFVYYSHFPELSKGLLAQNEDVGKTHLKHQSNKPIPILNPVAYRHTEMV